MHEKLVFCTKISKGSLYTTGMLPPTPSPLVSTETIPPPPPLLPPMQSYILGAIIDVNFNFIMHPKPGFSTPQIQKKVTIVGGGGGGGIPPPMHTLPLMSNTLLNKKTEKTVSPTPSYGNCYTFSAIIDVILNVI